MAEMKISVLIATFSILIGVSAESLANQTFPSLRSSSNESDLKCEVAMQRLLQASDYGPSLSGLKPGVKMQSFKVSDVKQSMSIATEAISKLPEASPEQQKLIDQAKPLRRSFDEAQEKYVLART